MGLFKKLSDDEYVSRIKKNIRTNRRLRWFLIFFFIAVAGVYVILLPKLIALTSGMSGHLPASCNYYRIGFPFGGFYAILFMFVFINGVLFFRRRFMNRTEKLMLKYIDEARRLNIYDEKDIVVSERIRNCIENSRGIRWLWVAGAVALFVSLFFLDSFFQTILSQKNPSVEKGSFFLGFNLGFFVLGKIGILCILPYLLFFFTEREISLLVKYYDLVHEKDVQETAYHQH